MTATATTTGTATVPFPRGTTGAQPHATAPLNDTTAYNHPSRLEGDNRIRNRSLNAATAPSHMKQPQQLKRSELELNKRKSYGDRVRQQAEDRLNTPDYTTGSDTGGKATTFEFPSYESFHKLRDSGNGKGISGTGDQRAVHHLQVNRRLNRRDSSDDDEEEDDGDQGVAYPRRPIPDRPRPRSAHFGDFDDEHLSFRRRHDVDNRLRRQSTRQSIELGRLKMQEKDDEIKPAVAISSVITGDMMGNTRGNPSSRFGTRGEQGFAARSTERLDGIADQGIAAVALTRRQSEMVTRLRDDVIEAKVVLLGSQGVGKTSLAKRYTQGVFSSQSATVNASLFTRKSVHDGVAVRLQIWDTCGEEKHRSLTKLYYRGAHAALILYDISDPQSFEDVRDWIHELRAVSEETDIFVVGAKYDLSKSGKRRVARRYARWKLATWLGVETSENLQYLSTLGVPTKSATDNDYSGQQKLSTPHGLNTVDFPSSPATKSNTVNPFSPTTTPISPNIASQQARPVTYRFLSLLSIPTTRSSSSAVIGDDDTDALASSITLHPGSRFTSGQRANSTSAATALMAMSVTSPMMAAYTPTTSQRLPTSASTSGLNLMSATSSIGPRRKSEDWSMNKAKDEFLRALGGGGGSSSGAGMQESEATRALKRTSGELLRPYSADAAIEGKNSATAEVVEYAVNDESGWGKLIVGTNVRIGETSSKTGKDVIEVFAALTSQLVLKRRQIRMEQARRAREIVDLSNTAPAGNQGTHKGSKTRISANCCT